MAQNKTAQKDTAGVSLPCYFAGHLLLERLARGGMAEVYLARAPTVSSKIVHFVALKRILGKYSQSEDFKEMFEKEVLSLQSMSHANVVGFKASGVDASTKEPYLVMEYVHGRNLRLILKKSEKEQKPISVPLAVHIICEAAAGLDYVHGFKDPRTFVPLNIVHRDVSPHNIMIGLDGSVKLIDFGIVKAKIEQLHAGFDDNLTRKGLIKGKFSYMSPEQLLNKALDHRSDVFSLGIILWELLTQRRLFLGESELETYQKVKTMDTPLVSSIVPNTDPDLERIVQKALQKDVGQRYESTFALQKDLSVFLSKSYPTFHASDLGQYASSLYSKELPRMTKLFAKYSEIAFDEGNANSRHLQTEDNSSMILPMQNNSVGSKVEIGMSGGGPVLQSAPILQAPLTEAKIAGNETQTEQQAPADTMVAAAPDNPGAVLQETHVSNPEPKDYSESPKPPPAKSSTKKRSQLFLARSGKKQKPIQRVRQKMLLLKQRMQVYSIYVALLAGVVLVGGAGWQVYNNAEFRAKLAGLFDVSREKTFTLMHEGMQKAEQAYSNRDGGGVSAGEQASQDFKILTASQEAEVEFSQLGENRRNIRVAAVIMKRDEVTGSVDKLFKTNALVYTSDKAIHPLPSSNEWVLMNGTTPSVFNVDTKTQWVKVETQSKKGFYGIQKLPSLEKQNAKVEVPLDGYTHGFRTNIDTQKPLLYAENKPILLQGKLVNLRAKRGNRRVPVTLPLRLSKGVAYVDANYRFQGAFVESLLGERIEFKNRMDFHIKEPAGECYVGLMFSKISQSLSVNPRSTTCHGSRVRANTLFVKLPPY